MKNNERVIKMYTWNGPWNQTDTLPMLKRKRQVQTGIIDAKLHDTKPRQITWLNCQFDLARDIILTTSVFSGQHQYGNLSHGPFPFLIGGSGNLCNKTHVVKKDVLV